MKTQVQIAITASRIESGWSAGELCQQAEQAEAMGFHSFWLPENHFTDDRAIPSPLTLLAAVAARTSTMKLGTTSYLLPIRHPIQAAEEVAVLDQLSGGRLILGVGRGIQQSVFDVFDLPPKEKRARFRENLDLMTAAWRGEPIQPDEAKDPVFLAPLPVQKPHPPVWIAAFGKLALQQAGGLGLPYLASPMESLEGLRENYHRYGEALSAHGHPPVATVPVMRTILISDDRNLVARTRDSLKKSMAAFSRSSEVPVDDWAIVGDSSFAREKLCEYVENLDVTHLIGGGRLPPVETPALRSSHEALAEIGSQLGR